MKTQWCGVNGARIAYTEAGSGPALLLLHGNSASKGQFRTYQTRHFADFRTIAVDSRAHGQTVSDDRELSFRVFADDVIALCGQLGITRAGVIGYSDGGNLALHLAAAAPELFPRIVAISPNYLASGSTPGFMKVLKAMYAVFWLFGARKILMRLDLMLKDIGLDEDDLRGIRSRTAVLYAEKDLITKDHILTIGRLIPGAVVHRIPRSTHLSVYKKPAAISFMRKFLAGG